MTAGILTTAWKMIGLKWLRSVRKIETKLNSEERLPDRNKSKGFSKIRTIFLTIFLTKCMLSNDRLPYCLESRFET